MHVFSGVKGVFVIVARKGFLASSKKGVVVAVSRARCFCDRVVTGAVSAAVANGVVVIVASIDGVVIVVVTGVVVAGVVRGGWFGCGRLAVFL